MKISMKSNGVRELLMLAALVFPFGCTVNSGENQGSQLRPTSADPERTSPVILPYTGTPLEGLTTNNEQMNALIKAVRGKLPEASFCRATVRDAGYSHQAPEISDLSKLRRSQSIINLTVSEDGTCSLDSYRFITANGVQVFTDAIVQATN